MSEPWSGLIGDDWRAPEDDARRKIPDDDFVTDAAIVNSRKTFFFYLE
jgi:hypothetical protein